MKKFFKVVLTFSLVLIFNLLITACTEDNIVEKLQNEYGAILEGGDFVEGSILKLDKIDVTTEDAESVIKSLENFGVTIDENNKPYIYDIFVEKDGKEVKPNGKVKLTIPMSLYDNIIGYDVYHIKDQGKVEKIVALYENGSIIFETNGFSFYAFVPIVSASQEAKVISLELDAHNAGFAYEENGELAEKTVVTIGAEFTPKAELVLVYGVTVDDKQALTKDTDYTVDLGGLDFSKEGVYEITYTYKNDTTIKAILEVEVVAPKYPFSAVVGEGQGKIYHNSLEQPNGYFGEHKEGEEVTLKAVADEKYEFVGWYDGENQISSSCEYTFTVGNKDSRVQAIFKAKVISLELDAHNAGFAYEENGELAEKTVVTIGAEFTPKAELVLVYGVTVDDKQALTKDTDYTVDLGGLDFSKEGVYEITYTYKNDTTIKAILEVEVVAPKYAFSAVVGEGQGKIYHNSLEQPNGYFGEHKEGEEVTLKAVADEKYEFVGWYVDENQISSSCEYTFTVNGNTYISAKFEKIIETLTFTYNGNLTRDAISYLGHALVVSPKDILVNETPLNEITDEAILEKITYKWLDKSTGLEVNTDDDITLDGTTYQFGRNDRIVGDELAGPCTVGEYEFALYYDGVKQLSVFAAVEENTFKKITSVAEFSTTEGVGLLQSLNYYTIVGVVDGQYYVMQMPKDGSKVNDNIVEAEARLVTADENGIISLGNKLDYVFSSVRYYVNEWVYYPSSTQERENLLVDFTTGYYGARLEQAGDGSFDYWIYRKGHVSLSGGRIAREKDSVDSSNYGHLTVFGENGAVKIYEPRKGQTENNALRLVKDGDKYVFTSVPADTNARQSYDIFIFKCYEEVNATYNFYGDLNKTYDEKAVSFNIYEKTVDVYTENYEDIYSLAKMETVRFRFTDIDDNFISVAYVDSDGNVNGPKDIGKYIMWIELKEKGEDGEVWNTKAKLHSFEIKDATSN